jgi:uncharacterized membrane protein YeaQ/YmgE (transglycosylase-associated protein family)
MPSEMTERHDAGETWKLSCPRCRYDTRGLAAERCPECGLAREEARSLLAERAELATPGQRIVALFISSAIGLLGAMVATVIASEARRQGFYDSSDFLIAAANISVCGAQIAIGVINWRRMMTHRPLVHFAWTCGLLFMLMLLAPA